MKKRWLAFIACILAVSMLVGCGSKKEEVTEDKSFLSDAAGAIYQKAEETAVEEVPEAEPETPVEAEPVDETFEEEYDDFEDYEYTVIGEAFLDNEVEINGHYFV